MEKLLSLYNVYIKTRLVPFLYIYAIGSLFRLGIAVERKHRSTSIRYTLHSNRIIFHNLFPTTSFLEAFFRSKFGNERKFTKNIFVFRITTYTIQLHSCYLDRQPS